MGGGVPTTQIQHHSMLVQTSFDSSIPGGGFGPHITGTDIPAYSDTVYSDTPLTVAVCRVPKYPFIYMK